MSVETELYYIALPQSLQAVALPVEILPVQEFLKDEPACKTMWEMVTTNFRTRSKFLSVWPGVRHVAVYRGECGCVQGLLLVSAPINWQIDYVVVQPDARGLGVASALVKAAVNEAFRAKIPYVMLTSSEKLRPLYEGCGFAVVGTKGVEGKATPIAEKDRHAQLKNG